MTASSLSSTARDVFWYLLLIIMLYTSVVTLLTIVWQMINLSIPDVLSYSYISRSQTMLGAMATLVIAWPVFILLSWLINRDLIAHPNKKDIWVRRWLLHLTLFVAALTIIIDLVSLTGTFFHGELTSRFFLKVLSVLIVTAAVFGYYLWELRRDSKRKTNLMRVSVSISTLIVLLAIVGGFLQTGSPAYQRSLRLDEQRVSDLQTIQWQVTSYWQGKDALPESLDDLSDSLSGFAAPTDPVSGATYGYRVTGELAFELCATFEEASVENRSTGDYAIPTRLHMGNDGNMYWDHVSGEVCFQRTIDPDVYGENK